MPVDHYENFPVASLLIPRAQRPAVEAIYRFARGADDIADEGNDPPATRLTALAAYGEELDRIATNQAPNSSKFHELAEAIRRHDLPIQLFRDLLSAFAQDVTVARYESYEALLDYCRRSANPVGRLMLHLFDRATPDNIARSDYICTALQLINFWQDVAIDWKKNRIYLPLDEMRRFRIDEAQIAEGRWNANYAALMDFQLDRTEKLMLAGADLARDLPGRFGWEIRFTVLGGLRILTRLRRVRADVWRARPLLGAPDWANIALRALIY